MLRKKLLLIVLLIVGCEEPSQHGCLDSQAANYDATASIDNNTCTYIDSCGVIDIDITNDCVQDCAGEWGGSATIDCAGVCGGDTVVDECGECNGDGASVELSHPTISNTISRSFFIYLFQPYHLNKV